MKYLYYPGCSLEGSAKEYNIATRAVMRKLGRMLMAGSQAFQITSGLQGGPIEGKARPAGRVLPCRISK